MADYSQTDNRYSAPGRAEAERALVNGYMMKVYNWMAAGLALSALTAWLCISSYEVFSYFIDLRTGGPTGLFWVCLVAELALVFIVSARIQKMQVGTAAVLFMVYAALNGFTLSPLLMAYTAASVTKAFTLACVTFVAASAYGHLTKRDLTSLGSFMFMGLIGIILATVVNIFLRSPMVDFIVSYLGVVIFIGLTAFDTQKLRGMLSQAANEVTVSKMAIFGALTLYLDFINLFIMLLRIVGDRR